MFGGQIWDQDTYRVEGIFDSAANIEATKMVKDIFNLGSRDSNIGYTGSMSKLMREREIVCVCVCVCDD